MIEIEYMMGYLKNVNIEKPEGLNVGDYGRYSILLERMDNKNRVFINKKKDKNEYDKLLEVLEFNTEKTFNNFIYKASSVKALSKKGDFIFINPIYAKHLDFELETIMWELFKNDITSNITKFIPNIKSSDVLELAKEFIDPTEYERLNFKINKENYYKVFDGAENEEGVYILFDNEEIVYIGKSKNIKNRVREHKKDKEFNSVKSIVFLNTSLIDLYEPFLINKYKPKYNNDLIRDSGSDILPEIKFK